MKITKSQLREIIREEIQSIREGGMGILTSDQADILQAIVMKNKSKPTRTLLNLALKSGHFKGVDKKELLGYIDGARQFVKYMKSHPMESIKLTKTQLREMIREELNEAAPKMRGRPGEKELKSISRQLERLKHIDISGRHTSKLKSAIDSTKKSVAKIEKIIRMGSTL